MEANRSCRVVGIAMVPLITARLPAVRRGGFNTIPAVWADDGAQNGLFQLVYERSGQLLSGLSTTPTSAISTSGSTPQMHVAS